MSAKRIAKGRINRMTGGVLRGRLCLLVGLAVMLTGCGFQPVYMPTATGKAGVAQRNLATVNVPIIPNRPGQLLRQALQRQFGDDSGTVPVYDLKVGYSVSGEGIAVLPNNIATHVRLIGNASWSLVTRDTAQSVLIEGNARTTDGVNVFDEQYFAADLETEAVQQRLAENLAQQIATQLAIWFRGRATEAPVQPAAHSG